ncbi:hypothetical protein ACJQWK_02534 [Exserohilum turcicum]
MHVPVIQSGVDEIRQDQDATKHRRILEWISPTDYPAQQSDIIKRRQEGTGQWFLDAPQVATWLSEPRAILFCPGIPGAGKTMVAAIAIDSLLKSVQSSSHGVAYVYCNYKAQEEQDTSRMLAAILKQLVQARPSLVEPVERLHEKHAGRGTRPSPDEVFSALRDVLAHYSTIHIVIDALDECRDSDGTWRQFLAKLRDLQAGRDVRLMATSRLIPEIVDWFNEGLKLEVQASEEDVKRFVAGQIYRLPKCIQRDPALQEVVQEKIVEAVDGMFLLARLHTDSLLDKKTAKDVKSTLAKLSKGSAALDDAYKEAVYRIEGQLSGDYKLAKRVLSWITYAKRPLTTTEICCALAVEPDEAELDPENIPDVEDLLSVCAGLVVVDQESAVIRLVHYTTQEYFERIQDVWDPGAQLCIASTCLTYLSFGTFQTGSCSSDREFEEKLQKHELLDYAAKHWGEHALTAEGEICELACSFLSCKELVSCAMQVLLRPRYTYQGYSQEYPKDSTGLHLVARFGLAIVLEALLLNQVGETALILERRDSEGQTLLYLAAEFGHQRMVELLLDKGTDINIQGGIYGNALQAASARGHETLVKLLLDKGADVNAQGGEYDNALQAASAAGHQSIVQLLLDNGADVNKQGGLYSDALYAAAAENHTAIVELLLNNGADASRHDSQRKSVLHYATNSVDCNISLIEFLLSRGAPANTTDINNMTPLHYCVKHGHKSTIGLLLDNGLSINVGVHRKSWSWNNVKTDTFYQSSVSESEPDIPGTSAGLTPLHFAALTGNLVMTKFLLERGADPNALSRYNESPMHLTLRKALHGPKHDDDWTNPDFRIETMWGFVEFEEEDEFDSISASITMDREGVLDALLADARTSLTIGDCQHNHPLHCVEYSQRGSGSVSMIQKLVSRGADPSKRNSKQQNALHLASRAGDHDAVAVLISLGVDPALTDNEGLNALHYAARSGDHETITVLLEATVATRPNLVALKDNRGRNPLHHLLTTNRVVQHETIQLLLDKGADGSELDASGNSPLASYFKKPCRGVVNVKTCQQLLSVEGSSLFVDKIGQTLGHLCTLPWKCSVQVLEMLKEHGVDLTQKDLESKTILHRSAIQGTIAKESLHYLLYVVGVEIDAKDASGKTALQYAADQARKAHHPDIFDRGRWDRSMKLLLEHDAS